jgi:hypothetical protein
MMLVSLLVLDGSRNAGTNTMLTHVQIASLKPSAKRYKLSDGDGLYLVVKSNGAKLWTFRYRHL